MSSNLDFLRGGGEAGALMRSLDWSKTAIGPAESWSPSLKMTVSTLLANRFPILLWWGPDYISLYNDAYAPILGAKHPSAMGLPFAECWPEVQDVLRPLVDKPFHGGPATWMEDIPLEVNRYGFVEETHFTISYSPVFDDTAPRGIGGVIATVQEITEKVVAQRRVVALSDLGARIGEARTPDEACTLAAETLVQHANDIPFALLYLIEADGTQARLAASAGVAPGAAIGPPSLNLRDTARASSPWPVAEVLAADTPLVVEQLSTQFAEIPRGPWPDPPSSAIALPLRSHLTLQLNGFLITGVSPRLKLDEQYRSFFDLTATQIATAITNAYAYETERKRAEALAEIDRVKTVFFSNVSHEFRTPLTLMLGPLEELLAEARDARAPDRTTTLLTFAHRNGLRLLKLVNSLLDFARIEAGRIKASYEPVDLASLTAELVSNFRSACEKAGLALEVDCANPGQPIYVDRDMWEKIVLNLLSNAFKFTLEGKINVSLRCDDSKATLTVEDTGCGVPESEIPRLFDRFHRVEGTRGRTHEGTGIGLALVQELVRLHGGTVEARSVLGRGSAFTVSIPLGMSHLPADRIRTPSAAIASTIGAHPYVEEALRWLPDPAAGAPDGSDIETALDNGLDQIAQTMSPLAASARASVLVADDNADMRDYLRRLLDPVYRLRVVADGAAALAAIREERPDLLLSDVMMPELDGFGLSRAIRAEPQLANLPIILLSARAGEESSIEGLDAGADDYLVKPFSARELLARIRANLDMARLRRDAEERLREMNESLEREVVLRTRALAAEMQEREKAEQALHQSQRLEAIGRLTGGVAHDFNNMLTVVTGQTELLLKAAGGSEAVKRAAMAIRRAADRGARLTSQLLAFSRSQNLRPSIVAINQLLPSVDELLRRAAGEAIQLDCIAAPDVWQVLVDSAQFESALLNLVINARDAMPDGGTLTINAGNAVVSAFDAARLDIAPGDYVIVSVTDTGVGMSAEVREHAFEPFFTTKDVGKGTGLGLAQIYGFAKQSGGVAKIESAPNRGTTVFLYLPRAEGAIVRETPQPMSPPQQGRGMTVLVVEDQADVRELIEETLVDLGYRVFTAGDGVAARNVLKSNEPIDLMLTDMVMPRGCSGFDLLNEGRRLRQEMKVILMSGYASDLQGGLGGAPNEFAFLEKPFRPAELAALIGKVLEKRA